MKPLLSLRIESIQLIFTLVFCSCLALFCHANEEDSLSIWMLNAVIDEKPAINITGIDTTPLNKAYQLAKETDNLSVLYSVYYYYGIYYNTQGNSLLALDYLQKSMALKAYHRNVFHTADIHNVLGNAYYLLGRYDEATTQHELAIQTLERDTSKRAKIKRITVGINFCNIHHRQGNIEEALVCYTSYYNKLNDIPNIDKRLITSSLQTMGFIYLERNQPNEALRYLKEHHDLVTSQPKNVLHLSTSYGNLAYCEYLLNNFDKAYDYYEKSLALSESNNLPNVTYITYKDLSDTYLADNKPKLAIKYLNKHYHLRDSIQGIEVQKQLNDLKVIHETSLKEQEIIKLEQKNKLQRQRLLITYGGIGLLALLSMGIYAYFRQLSQRRKEINLLNLEQAKQREELQTLKMEKLNQELSYKKQDITKMAIEISKKQEFSNELLNELNGLKQHLKPNATKDWRRIESSIKEKLQTKDEQMVFLENIENINQAFFDKLVKKYPNISKTELELCGFIRLGLSNKEIASLRAVTPEAIRMSRHRLRRKLKLSSNQEMENLLYGI